MGIFAHGYNRATENSAFWNRGIFTLVHTLHGIA